MVFADLTASRIAFYATVATVLPIIMLALAFQINVRGVLWPGPIGRKMAIAFMLAAVAVVIVMWWAEWNAILSLSDGVNHNYQSVFGGATIGTLILFAGTLLAVARKLVSAYQKDQQSRVWQTVGKRVVREEVENADAEDAANQSASPPGEGDGPEPRDGNEIEPD